MSGIGSDPMVAARLMETDEVRRKMQLDELRKNLEPGVSKEQKLREACDGFEAIFLNKLWQQMRQTVEKGGYLHSKEEEAYVGMFDQQLSMKMADAGGMGLGDQLFDQLQQRLTEAGSVTKGIPHRFTSEELKPLREERKPMPLRKESEGLPIAQRPLPGPRDDSAALAAELARRIVTEHQDDGQVDLGGGSLPGDALVEAISAGMPSAEAEDGE